MSAFEKAQTVEEMARRELMPWLSAIYAQIQPIDEEYTGYDPTHTMQTLGGDYLMERTNGSKFLAEFKAEKKNILAICFLKNGRISRFARDGFLPAKRTPFFTTSATEKNYT